MRGAAPGAAVGAALFHVLGTRDAVPVVDLGVFAYPLLLAGPVALLFRRKAPIAVLAVAAAATVGFALTAEPRFTYAVAAVVALFHAVRTGHAKAAVPVAGAAYTLWLILTAVLPGVARPTVRDAVLTGVGAAVAVLLAGAAKVRGEQYAEMAKYHAEQKRARDEQERRQASEERLRMARELHDVLGHHLSLISVQAGVGLHLMDSRPEQAREALTAIRAASAEALAEMRGVLGVLRTEGDEAAPRQPAPGLDRLGELTADAGIAVETRIEGERRPVPPEVDRAAYRIVQEALTNVRRHGPADAHAVVTVGYRPAELAVTVTNDGPLSGSDAAGNGIGGMRARAEALGGTLSAGPGAAGGFQVAAVLPVGGTP